MPSPKFPWRILPPAAPKYAFFLSHVSEDKPEVERLRSLILDRSSAGGRLPLACFLDATDWPQGNRFIGAIRELALESQYMVMWVAPRFLEQSSRGWAWIEFAYADLIHQARRVNHPDVLNPYLLPLFQGVKLADIERTPLIDYWQQSLLRHDEVDPVPAAADRLVAFHEQQVRRFGSGPA
jgi:hypothetical protein